MLFTVLKFAPKLSTYYEEELQLTTPHCEKVPVPFPAPSRDVTPYEALSFPGYSLSQPCISHRILLNQLVFLFLFFSQDLPHL